MALYEERIVWFVFMSPLLYACEAVLQGLFLEIVQIACETSLMRLLLYISAVVCGLSMDLVEKDARKVIYHSDPVSQTPRLRGQNLRISRGFGSP